MTLLKPRPSRAFVLFETEELVGRPVHLAAGPLSAEFVDGGLRYVRWGESEILRAISFIVRDTHWGTHRVAIGELGIRQLDDRFEVRYRGEVTSADGSFSFFAVIEGTADGHLSFEANGSSSSGFVTNRTGLVVLHPLAGTVGRALTVETVSGERIETRFPDLVDPSIPATDIRALTYDPLSGVRVAVRFSGEAFEMEDHRNWTDASFKTYVRPLSLGFPYGIAPGEALSQSVRLAIEGPPAPRLEAGGDTVITLGGRAGQMPACGLFVEQENLAASLAAAPGLSLLHPSFVTGRVDLRGDKSGGCTIKELTKLSDALGAPLAIEAIIPGVDPEAELVPLAAALAASKPRTDSLLVVPARDLKSRPAEMVPAGEADLPTILKAARKLFPTLRIGGGMVGAFPEINRNRPPPGIDFVTHATQATIHSADDRSVMETLESLPHIARSVRAFAGDVPYRIGSATIGMPPDACALTVAGNPAGGRVCMSGREPRQWALFGAAFAMGYAAAAAECGVDALTFASPAGDFGLVDESGAHRPISAVVSALSALAGANRIETILSGDVPVAALCAETPEGPVLWLANLADTTVTIRVEGQAFGRCRMLDAETLLTEVAGPGGETALSDATITLDSYALCCLRS